MGHWKDKCPLSVQKSCVTSDVVPRGAATGVTWAAGSGFEPFLIDACVSLEGSTDTVNVRVLRDTGAKHSFVVESAFPFSGESQVGDFIVSRGMELGYVPVP